MISTDLGNWVISMTTEQTEEDYKVQLKSLDKASWVRFIKNDYG